MEAAPPPASGGEQGVRKTNWLWIAAAGCAAMIAAGGWWFSQSSRSGGETGIAQMGQEAPEPDLAEPVPAPVPPEPPLREAGEQSTLEEPATPEQTAQVPVPAPASPPASRALAVRFTSDPPGARIAVEGRNQSCTAPCALDVPRGEYVARADLAGFRAERRTFQAGSDPLEIAFDLKPATGVVMISSQPSGAAIFVDGERINQVTNAQVELPVGRHTIRLDAGTVSADREVAVSEGGLVHLRFTLDGVR